MSEKHRSSSPARSERDRFFLLRVAFAALALASAAPAFAACSCGFDDGQFTQTTISIDGTSSSSDGPLTGWSSVRGDTDNVVCDAAGTDNGESAPHPDRDWKVQSTGRDLLEFAFTWDADYVYFFTQRAGSTSNIQRFLYYADEDNDGLMETGENVVGVEWQGNTRAVTVQRYTYAAATAGGDSMVDGSDFADGYDLPGSLSDTGSPLAIENDTFGSTNGSEMEFRVSWDRLTGDSDGSLEASDGPTAITFHVSSLNTNLNSNTPPNGLDDNMAGCGGGGGTSQFAAIDLTPDRSGSGLLGATVCLAHDVTNNGNDDDIFDLYTGALPSQVASVALHHDADGSDTLSGGDTLLTDSGGDAGTTVDTGTLAPAATKNLLTCYTLDDDGNGYSPSGAGTVTVTARSDFNNLVTDAVTDTLTIVLVPDPLLLKASTAYSDPVNAVAADAKRIPGALLTYAITITNDGGGTIDDDTTVITDPIPAGTALFVGDIGGAPSGPVSQTAGTPTCNLSTTFTALASTADDVEFSKSNGATWDAPSDIPVPDANGVDGAVTHLRIRPHGTFAGDSASGQPTCTWRFRVRVE